MSTTRAFRRSSSTNQSIASSNNSTIRKTSVFPLPNATKPRYIVPKKIEFNDLPDDVFLSVFRYLTPIDLLNIATVCRRWHAVSQDESLWRSLAISYGLHQQTSTLTNKGRIQAYLNNQIKRRLTTLFPNKFDPLKSYTGIADYQKSFQKYSDQIQFFLAFCDDRHQIIWSQKYDTIKYFDTSMSIRWFDLTMPECLSRVHFIRLFSTISIDIETRPNRTRLPKDQEQLADVTQKPARHTQKIQSFLHEYKFNWNTIRQTSISQTKETKSPIRVSVVPNEDDYLIATYDKDRSYAFLVFNMNYVSFHEHFFTGLRVTTLSNTSPLSHSIISPNLPTSQHLEVSVFLCIRNMTTVFLRHRFQHCRLKHSPSMLIELVRITDMNEELGPEFEQLPKFNWKTGIFSGTINDMCLIDLVVLNEQDRLAFSVTLPAKMNAANGDELGQGGDYILSSKTWHLEVVSQCNNRLRLNGTIMRLDSEYCALGKTTESWHLQNMICQF